MLFIQTSARSISETSELNHPFQMNLTDSKGQRYQFLMKPANNSDRVGKYHYNPNTVFTEVCPPGNQLVQAHELSPAFGSQTQSTSAFSSWWVVKVAALSTTTTPAPRGLMKTSLKESHNHLLLYKTDSSFLVKQIKISLSLVRIHCLQTSFLHKQNNWVKVVETADSLLIQFFLSLLLFPD